MSYAVTVTFDSSIDKFLFSFLFECFHRLNYFRLFKLNRLSVCFFLFSIFLKVKRVCISLPSPFQWHVFSSALLRISTFFIQLEIWAVVLNINTPHRESHVINTWYLRFQFIYKTISNNFVLLITRKSFEIILLKLSHGRFSQMWK